MPRAFKGFKMSVSVWALCNGGCYFKDTQSYVVGYLTKKVTELLRLTGKCYDALST
jgi:hypothetical protein